MPQQPLGLPAPTRPRNGWRPRNGHRALVMNRSAPMRCLPREKGESDQRSTSQPLRLLRSAVLGAAWFLASASFVIIVLPIVLFLNVLAWNICGVFVTEETPGIPFPPTISSSVRFGDCEIVYGTPAFIPSVVVLMLPTVVLIVVLRRKTFQLWRASKPHTRGWLRIATLFRLYSIHINVKC